MSREFEHLHPMYRPVIAKFIALSWSRLGVRLKLIETWRDNEQQLIHWKKGRDHHGKVIDRSKVVTFKRPGHSWHNLPRRNGQPVSLAAHLVPELPEGKLLGFGSSKLGPPEIALYTAVIHIGISLGQRSGGNWDGDRKLMEPGEDDLGHWEFHPGFNLDQAVGILKSSQDLDVLVQP